MLEKETDYWRRRTRATTDAEHVFFPSSRSEFNLKSSYAHISAERLTDEPENMSEARPSRRG